MITDIRENNFINPKNIVILHCIRKIRCIMLKEMEIKKAKRKPHVVDEPIKWSAKMLESFEQAKRGEIYKVDVNNFWNV